MEHEQHYVKVTNADESPISRYGFDFKPGETLWIEAQVVTAYSLMEISLASQVIARRLSRATRIFEDEMEYVHAQRRDGRPVHVKLIGELGHTPGRFERFRSRWSRRLRLSARPAF